MTEISMVITTLPISDQRLPEGGQSIENSSISIEIASKLVDQGLASCVNISSPVTSIYKWEGKTCTSIEQVLTIKTPNSKLAALEASLKELHPYKVFEFIVLPIDYSNQTYLNWVLEAS